MVRSKTPWLLPVFAASLLSVATGCGPSQIAPPKAPEPVMPSTIDLPAREPSAGKSRVILDAADGQRAAVSEVMPTEVRGVETEKRLCVAPCVAELPQGVHVFRFADERDPSRQGTARVELGEKPKLVRHAMGETKTHVGTAVAGWILFTLGTGTIGAAGVVYKDEDHPTKNELTTAGILLGVGATLALVGLPMIFASRPRLQPGATTERTISR
ncbi:MAG: hypothetical protein JST00_15445 [Deltaproteobacteria bacterium]|nr:hypothetical protein [Deltaproteobacteria bacterium]